MPKVLDTRKIKARTLISRLDAGPSFHPERNFPEGPHGGATEETFTPAQAHAQYQLWAKSWIIPL